ncbi:MAG: hypothetical protein Q8L55_02950 [Phycisphaerales bacterium]|nr:hypothetical protein [Phycisphaerales bacterium]
MLLSALLAASMTLVQPAPAKQAPAAPLDWKGLEGPFLSGHVQLTQPEKFFKAGEAYFDHQSPPRWVVFQGVERPERGKEASANYAMYVAKLNYDASGNPTGIDAATRISPAGSASTCAWFDPNDPSWVYFGCTVTAPGAEGDAPGYSRDRSRYTWQFPAEMEICRASVPQIEADLLRSGRYKDYPRVKRRWFGDARADLVRRIGLPVSSKGTPEEIADRLEGGGGETVPLEKLFSRPGYDAEGSFSPDGYSYLYTHVDPETKDPDLYIYNVALRKHVPIVKAAGYDGGPFFSPDGKWICYRSDRKGDNNLQLFVAELKFGNDGVLAHQPLGMTREVQLTADDQVVSWCPYWHPSMKYMVYATSAVSHSNYEVFAIEFDPTKSREQLKRTRITSADGFDGLPVFSDDGNLMMWTSQRGPKLDGEQKPSSQLWIARVSGEPVWAHPAPDANGTPIAPGISVYPSTPTQTPKP